MGFHLTLALMLALAPVLLVLAVDLRCCRLKVGITDGFVRVSCGIEDTEDLVAALQKGLDDL